MIKPFWVVQTNLGNSYDIDTMITVFNKNDIPYQGVNAIPFSDELPEIEWPGPVIFYGATGFISNAFQSNRWSPCAFFDGEQFRYREYIRQYGTQLLNVDAVITTLEAFSKEPLKPDQTFFIRPDKDLKEFVSEVVRFDEFRDWGLKIIEGDFQIDGETAIIVSEPKHISQEWRLFLINNRYCTGSQYKKHGRLHVDPNVPLTVIDFAETMAEVWSPHPIFAMDIAESDGTYKIVELGCVNSCGFYASDIEKFVKSITIAVVDGYL